MKHSLVNVKFCQVFADINCNRPFTKFGTWPRHRDVTSTEVAAYKRRLSGPAQWRAGLIGHQGEAAGARRAHTTAAAAFLVPTPQHFSDIAAHARGTCGRHPARTRKTAGSRTRAESQTAGSRTRAAQSTTLRSLSAMNTSMRGAPHRFVSHCTVIDIICNVHWHY